MSFDKKDICLIIQGYANNKEQLLNDVKKYYLEDNITNIIISTYKLYVLPELNNYAKVLENDDIGENIKVSKIVSTDIINTFSYNNDEIVNGLNIEKWNWNDPESYWAEKGVFKMGITTKRGIKIAKEYFPKCKYYLIIRGDMTINNLSYLINKWSILNFKIDTEKINNKKIILKYNNQHEKIYNIVVYLAFGYCSDIENYYNFKNAFVPSVWSRGLPERIQLLSYILNCNKIINSIDDLKEIYYNWFYHEKEFNIDWPKYNMYGIWGNNDCGDENPDISVLNRIINEMNSHYNV